MSSLTEQQKRKFEDQGYLIIPDYLTLSEVRELRARAEKIIEDFSPDEVSIFSTVDQTKTSDDYFIDSGDKVRCFFEEGAFDLKGRLIGSKEQSINKIGHALHDLDSAFQRTSYKPDLVNIARGIGMKDPLMVQSQYIFKQPMIGGKVSAHQDSTFIFTDPPSCIGFWMALEDATIENGCLMGIPGSHRHSYSDRRFVRDPACGVKFIGSEYPDWDLTRMISFPVPSGSMIILHGELVHMSNENHSSNSRHAYIIHAVEGDRDWPSDNWLQRPADLPFRHIYQQVDR